MANYIASDTDLTSVANAIRTKGGTSASLIFPSGFVSAVQNIPSGGGGSTLITKNIIANGTYNASSDSADGYSSVTVAVPSLLVRGTFTPSDAEKGTSKNITIPYSGSGYPVSVIIYPTNGAYNTQSAIYSSTQRYAILMWFASKADTGTAPDYDTVTDNDKNGAFSVGVFKYSSSDATSYSTGYSKDYKLYISRWGASASHSQCVRIKSKTSMDVFIADTSYGFLSGTEYTYEIVYSS